MSKIKILIVEDQVIVSEEIKEILLAKGYDVIGQCTSANDALEVLTQEVCDVAILDINIEGEKDGIELAKDMLNDHQCAIIFLTAYADDHFLKRAKEVKPASYIVKPFEETNLHMAIEIAFNNLIASGVVLKEESFHANDSIFIKDQSRYRKIQLDEIQYAEAEGSYTKVVLEKRNITLAINLKAFEKHLGSLDFMRIHRSYVINLGKVDEFEGNRVFINKEAIPISASFKERFLKKITVL
ncbi:MAG: response regulator [Bacteroidota bacterium]